MVTGGHTGLSLRSEHTDLGIHMNVETDSYSSTSNSLTDRLGAGPRTETHGHDFLGVQQRVRDGDLSLKKVPTAKHGADVGTKPVSAYSTTAA